MQLQEIFASEPQTFMGFAAPETSGLQFPATLAERYQPRRIDDFIGVERPKTLLRNLIANPRPCNLLFIGPPGAGKSVMGMALAEHVGSLKHISAQKCDVSTLDALRDSLAYHPPRGKFWVVLIDEADQMTEKAQLQFLSRLDGTASLRPVFGGGFERGEPLPIIWIMTCNGRGENGTDPPLSLAARFLSRCMRVEFEAVTPAELAPYLEKIWNQERGSDVPAGYFDYIASGVGVRDALMRLDTDLLAGPRPVPDPEPEPDQEPRHQPRPHPIPRNYHGTGDEMLSPAKRAWITRRANQSEKAGTR